MEVRDCIRFFVAIIVMMSIDLLTHSLWGLPLNENIETLVLAVGYTLVCAIRDKRP